MSTGVPQIPCDRCQGSGQETVRSTTRRLVNDRWRRVPVDVTVGCGKCFGKGWVAEDDET